ncbi:MAG TPA: hypothetical protein VH796_11185, partial [Nitrososphaeraceae archaeon]
MQNRSPARSRILDAASYELRLLVRGILLPASLVLFFTYVIISIVDVGRSGSFNSIPSSIVLAVGTAVSFKLLFYTKLEKIEIKRFRFIFLALICWLIGEVIYVYNQAFVGITVPYPSIADIFYLSATIFLSCHLYSILYLKKSILKKKSFLYLGLLASIFPIYLIADTIHSYGSTSLMEFVTNILYYVTDAIVIFPCIPIILSLRKNDPFVFHWLLIALSIFILVAADLVYTFISSINEELLKNTEWLFSFIYSIGYLLLSMSILWFSKIKEVLEYKKFSNVLRYDQGDILDSNDENQTNEFIENVGNPNQLLKSITNIIENTKERADILFGQYIIQKGEIIRLIDNLAAMTRKNKSLNIRILLPSQFDRKNIPSNVNLAISIKYFDRELCANTITSILDDEFMYILGSESDNVINRDRYFIQQEV